VYRHRICDRPLLLRLRLVTTIIPLSNARRQVVVVDVVDVVVIRRRAIAVVAIVVIVVRRAIAVVIVVRRTVAVTIFIDVVVYCAVTVVVMYPNWSSEGGDACKDSFGTASWAIKCTTKRKKRQKHYLY